MLSSTQALRDSFHRLRERLQSSLVPSGGRGPVALELGRDRVEPPAASSSLRFSLEAASARSSADVSVRARSGRIAWFLPSWSRYARATAGLAGQSMRRCCWALNPLAGDERRGVDLVLRQVLARQELQHVEAPGDLGSVDDSRRTSTPTSSRPRIICFSRRSDRGRRTRSRPASRNR